MRVLQLGKFYPIRGGVERVMYDLTVGLSENEVNCDMLCTTISREKPTQIQLNPLARIIVCKTLFTLAATTFSPQLLWRLRRTCQKYDIIHVHHPDPMVAGALLLSAYKGKVVLHWHSDIIKQRFWLKLYSPVQRWLINRADVIVGTTPTYIAESPELQTVQNKTAIIPIGIDPVSPQPKEVEKITKRYPGKKIIFSLGRLVEYKGYRYLIEAAKYLNDEYVIVIGGNGPLKESLQTQIENEGLTDKVFLHGFISDEQKDAFYQACTLFCLSSIQKTEAFAIVQVEAMSCGKPIVACRIPGSGVSWVNEHEVTGLNVTPENAQQLAEAIHKICSDNVIYNRYAEQAKERYQKLFAKHKMIEACLRLYKKILI